MKQDTDFLERELRTLSLSPSIQYLEKLTWANRMRATLASVREEGVVQIQRLDRQGTRAYLVDDRSVDHIVTGSFQDSPEMIWARQPENKGRGRWGHAAGCRHSRPGVQLGRSGHHPGGAAGVVLEEMGENLQPGDR